MSQFAMPKLGITMDEGTVSRWLIKEGDAVEAGDPILTIETDKAEVEVTANEGGVLLQIVVPEGGTVPVGETIAYFGQPGEAPPAVASPSTATATPADRAKPAASATSGDRVSGAGTATGDDARRREPKQRISPLARRIAREHQLDLTGVTGTGPLERIIARDVRSLLEEREGAAVLAAGPIDSPPISSHSPSRGPGPALASPPPGRREPLSRMRRIIAERMTHSVQTIPTFRLTAGADVTETVQLRSTLVDLVSRSDIRLTLTDFLIQAVAQALTEHPEANASFVPGNRWDDSYISYAHDVNVGLAVALDEGLIVPTIYGADQLSLIKIAERRVELIDRARNGNLLPEHMGEGTFTISNLGSFGIDQFDAIINPPQAAILAVGRARSENVLSEDATVHTRTVMNLTLTCDHRVLDGAQGAAFLRSIVQRLERADEYVLV